MRMFGMLLASALLAAAVNARATEPCADLLARLEALRTAQPCRESKEQWTPNATCAAALSSGSPGLEKLRNLVLAPRESGTCGWVRPVAARLYCAFAALPDVEALATTPTFDDRSVCLAAAIKARGNSAHPLVSRALAWSRTQGGDNNPLELAELYRATHSRRWKDADYLLPYAICGRRFDETRDICAALWRAQDGKEIGRSVAITLVALLLAAALIWQAVVQRRARVGRTLAVLGGGVAGAPAAALIAASTVHPMGDGGGTAVVGMALMGLPVGFLVGGIIGGFLPPGWPRVIAASLGTLTGLFLVILWAWQLG